uniref:Photosystem II reaction center protein Y n=1 Tax=Amicula sp. isolate GU52X-4 cfCalB7 TaxID=3003489 RepID=A0A9E8YZD1_9STRA|nr:Y protein of photosystem II [Amicula sp. isolate GU52X-4 cfCalB7]
MDSRLFIVGFPVVIAASWVLFNIGRLALQQVQRLTR